MKPYTFAFIIVAFCWAIGENETQARLTKLDRVAQQQTEPSIDGGIELKAPQTCDVGELVRFDARGSTVDSLVWVILPATDDFEEVEDNRRAFFSAREPGDYIIFIAASKDGKAISLIHRLTVNGVPAPLTGLSSKVGQWLTLLPEMDNRNAKLLAMAGVFKTLVDRPVEPERMVEATALANVAVLGESLPLWIPFLDKLGSELDDLIDAGELDTIEQYKTTWGEIASTLERHAKK